MLKCLAIFAMILAFTQAPSNTPRQGGNQQNHAAHDAGKSNAISPPITQSSGQAGVIAEKSDGKPKSEPAQQNSNYWKEAFEPATLPNWALVIVGGIAGCLAWRTLKGIRKQADLMETQAGHMAGQLEEMRKAREIENKTLILQYRPKIIVRNTKVLQFSIDLGKPWECEIRFQIVNTGGSPAHIRPGSYIQLVSALSNGAGKNELKWGDPCQISSVILEPGVGIVVEECLPTGVLFDLQWENFNQGWDTQPRRYIYFTGVLYYTDNLDIPRSTGIHRRLEPKSGEFAPNKESDQEYSD